MWNRSIPFQSELSSSSRHETRLDQWLMGPCGPFEGAQADLAIPPEQIKAKPRLPRPVMKLVCVRYPRQQPLTSIDTFVEHATAPPSASMCRDVAAEGDAGERKSHAANPGSESRTNAKASHGRSEGRCYP